MKKLRIKLAMALIEKGRTKGWFPGAVYKGRHLGTFTQGTTLAQAQQGEGFVPDLDSQRIYRQARQGKAFVPDPDGHRIYKIDIKGVKAEIDKRDNGAMPWELDQDYSEFPTWRLKTYLGLVRAIPFTRP